MVKVNRGDLVRLDWDDHFSANYGWKSFKEWAGFEIKTPVCSSVGVVVGIDKKFITIAQNWHGMPDGDHRVADYMSVLKNNINKTTVLKKKELK
jgi:hypothetical protein